MPISILSKKQLPGVAVFKDQANIFTVLPQVPLMPLSDADVASKKYVDDKAIISSTGLDIKESVRVATVSIPVGTYNATAGAKGKGQFTGATNVVDETTLVNGNRILVKDHGTGAAKGIYVVTIAGTGTTGVWDRAIDFDDDADVSANAFTFVEEGTLADSAWVLTTNGVITIGGVSGTNLSFTQFAGSGTAVTLGANTSGILLGANGGTGVNNSGKTITLGGNLATTGAFNTTLAVEGSNIVTFPNANITVARIDAAQSFAGIQTFADIVLSTSISGATTFGGNITSANYFIGATATQTLTNKTIVASSNTITDTSAIVGDSLTFNGTKYVKTSTVKEQPTSGAIDGLNLVFGFAGTPVANTELLFVNGVYQTPGAGFDYTITGNTLTFVVGNAPIIGSILTLVFQKA